MRTKYPHTQNLILDREDPNTHEVLPGAWREQETLTALQNLRGNNTTAQAKAQRDYLRTYYSSDVGRVPWQDQMAILL
jgi:hypothetical protein